MTAWEKNKLLEKTKKSLARLITLPPQPFIVFSSWQYERGLSVYRAPWEVIRSLGSFNELMKFLLCFFAEIEERIKHNTLDSSGVINFSKIGVEHAVYGAPCQLTARQVFQIARDLGVLDANGHLLQQEPEPALSWQIDISFLALAGATEGMIPKGCELTNRQTETRISRDWDEALDLRLEKFK